MSNPFDYLNALNANDREKLNELGSDGYTPFMINRGLSYYMDTIAIANEINQRHHLDNDMQMHFYINTVRKRKRFSKWHKAEKSDNLEAVMTYYKYNYERAVEALSLLSDDDIVMIKQIQEKGGKC
jgi:hypothetical protein